MTNSSSRDFFEKLDTLLSRTYTGEYLSSLVTVTQMTQNCDWGRLATALLSSGRNSSILNARLDDLQRHGLITRDLLQHIRDTMVDLELVLMQEVGRELTDCGCKFHDVPEEFYRK